MSKRLLQVICLTLILSLLLGCKAGHSNRQDGSTGDDLPIGLYIPVEGLPKIDECSADGYEKHQNQFPGIAAVRYFANGTATEISADDGRVYQLINFIQRSFDDGSFGMQFGYESPDSIQAWYEEPSPMLEITFLPLDDDTQASGLSLCSKLLIRGGTAIKIFDSILFDDAQQEGVLLWPYNLLLKKSPEKHLCYPEKELWIDMLVYAGFSGEG